MPIYGTTYETLHQFTRDLGYSQVPATDLLYSDFLVTMRKTGEPFSEKTLTSSDVVDLGDGWYVFKWSATDMGVMGEFYYQIEALIPGGSYVSGRLEVVPPPQYMNSEHPTCVVTGNIVDIGGNPAPYTWVIFRPKSVPIIAGPSLIGSNRISTCPDAFGNFSVKLLRNIQVLVEIEGSGIRHLITIPDLDTVPITSLLPPVPPPL